MKDIIELVFKGLSAGFDKIPFLNKLKGYRSVIGLVGLGVVQILGLNSIGDPAILSTIELGFLAFTGLSLNAK